LQRDLVRLAIENAALNGMSARISLIAGDLLRPPPRLSPGMFDHVMANPPYIERGRGTPAGSPSKAMATIEGEANLGDWVRFALAMVRGRGTVSFVHRADRIDALIGHLAGRAGDIAIFRTIVVPLSVPAIAAYGIFQFLWVWNDLLMALVFVQKNTNFPMTVQIQNLLSQYGTEWQLLAAGAFLLMIVPLLVFFSLQRYFVQGLLAGSVK